MYVLHSYEKYADWLYHILHEHIPSLRKGVVNYAIVRQVYAQLGLHAIPELKVRQDTLPMLREVSNLRAYLSVVPEQELYRQGSGKFIGPLRYIQQTVILKSDVLQGSFTLPSPGFDVLHRAKYHPHDFYVCGSHIWIH